MAVENGLAHSVRTTTIEYGFASGHAIIAPVSPSQRHNTTAQQPDLRDERSRPRDLSEAVRLGFASRGQSNEAESHYKMACALWRTKKTEGVERHLLEAARLDPRSPSVHEALALWFLRHDRNREALKHSTLATALKPNHLPFVITHADVLAASGQTSAAWNLIAPLVSRGPGGAWLARVYAKLAPKIGRETEAAEFLEESLRAEASAPRLSPDDIARMHYAAAGLFDTIGRYDQAFAYATMAKKSGPAFDAVDYSRGVSDRMRYFTKRRFASLARVTHASRRPVFVVGMPRSGTSLVEQILASHPAVYGAGELRALSEISEAASSSQWAQGRACPGCFDLMSPGNADELAEEYLSTIGELNTSATYVTDKMPMNYLFLGMAALLLPQCRVIHCMRDARDTCLSCYLTDFGDRQSFTSNIADLASVYRDYRRLMDHWKKVLPLPILDVSYEQLVMDPAGQTRRMLEFLNLPWDERCMEFHQSRRPVATASREQVRRPIYASSIGRWKHYGKHISEWMGL
jgi:tetratricopeptide (TPR) repeat protein